MTSPFISSLGTILTDWTATPQGDPVALPDGRFEQRVLFTLPQVDHPNQFSQHFQYADAADLQARVVYRLQARCAELTDAGSISRAPISLLVPVTASVPTVSKAQIDQANFAAAWGKVDTIQRLLAAGSTAYTQADLSAAQAALNTLPFNPAWVGQ